MTEETAWAIYFGGIVSFQYHPRNEAIERMTLKQCGEVADQMLEEHRRRKKGGLWVGQPQHKQQCS